MAIFSEKLSDEYVEATESKFEGMGLTGALADTELHISLVLEIIANSLRFSRYELLSYDFTVDIRRRVLSF